jgi:hypothetical protein
MKWIIVAPIIILLTACACCTNRDVVAYRSVTFRPAVVTTAVVAPVVTTPVYYDPVTIVDDSPIDVTTTTVDYY